METHGTPLVREVQHFRQPWLWAIVLLLAGWRWYVLLVQVVMGIRAGGHPAPDVVVLILWLVFGVGLVAFFWWTRLITEVRADGLYVRFVPFHLKFKRLPYSQLARWAACTYRPILDYGGWGIRYGRNGMAYNVSGNRGVQLEFTSGKRLLIGSQQPEVIVRAMQAASGRR
ncbi:MAG: DUF6141 family protein [bacterium]|nr:DUF6141 family protein [candidate division KSB1 bacterium]MDH7559789.1 DUF6141 family protein [bacterium]